jgi:mono/diheme cytochrome c family protein
MRYTTIVILFFVSAIIATAIAQQAPPTSASSKPAATTPAPAQLNPPYGLTAQDKTRKNPEKFTADSVEKGKKLYASQCAMCHGVTGNGKGDLAAAMKLTLPDFTNPPSLAKYTDGELFKILSVGAGMMPGQGKRLSDTHLWDIVNFLRAVGGEVPPSPVVARTAAKTPK